TGTGGRVRTRPEYGRHGRRPYDRPVELVARELVGAVVVSRVGGVLTAGRIVETEAYLGRDDPASHAFGGRRNAHNASLYGPPGTWYVYRSYGMHWCANLVCGPHGLGAAVLLRALEPLEGLDVMRERRGVADARLLCAGPGRLCQALGITRDLDGVLDGAGPVTIEYPARRTRAGIVVTPRIGITKAADWPLRFVLEDSKWASRPGRSDATPSR
ncbi:MAG: DNA-3-methyladenine glycosylase, partial [Gemmatimonadota bacterium]